MDLVGIDFNGFIIIRDSEGLEYFVILWDDFYFFFRGMILKYEKVLKEEFMFILLEERLGKG